MTDRAIAIQYGLGVVWGCGADYVNLVLNGEIDPSLRFKAFLAEIVDKPIDVLFPAPVDPAARERGERAERGFEPSLLDSDILRQVAEFLIRVADNLDAADAIEGRSTP
jgi:hypothetical protein